MKTTLNKIREHSPCSDGWEKLLKHLGKTKADDEPLGITTILDSNGFEDALWCLRAVEGNDREIRLYAVWCARQVQHLMTDQRSIDALDVAERYANGQATDGELSAVRSVAPPAQQEPVATDGKWYWVRYEGLGKTYEAPALYRESAKAFYSVEFSGIPAQQVEVLCEYPPPQRKPLSDEQIEEIAEGYLVDYRIPAGCAWNFARDIEATHGIKE